MATPRKKCEREPDATSGPSLTNAKGDSPMATETMYLKNGSSTPIEHVKPVIFSWEIIFKVGAIVSTLVIAMAGGGWLVSPAKTSDLAALSAKVDAQGAVIQDVKTAVATASNSFQSAILDLRKDFNDQMKATNELTTQLRLENTRLATQFKDMAVNVVTEDDQDVVIQPQAPPKRKRFIIAPKKRGLVF